MNSIRIPAVQGRFYPSDKDDILSNLKRMEDYAEIDPRISENCTIIGGVVPHAAHVYSGTQTTELFKHLYLNKKQIDTIIIINPNHSGVGPAIALDPHDQWMNALGKVDVDQILNRVLPYESDASAQEREHSAEVLIPFIQYYSGEDTPKILPICMRDQSAVAARELAKNLHNAIHNTGRKVLLLASSDFSHFLSPEKGYSRDQLVLERIMDRDITGIEKVVKEKNISVCGYGPIMTLMEYASEIDPAYKTKVIARGHSGEVSPSKEVVDYISMLVSITEE